MEEKKEKIRWGILATGSIAASFAEGVINSSFGKLVAVGSRSQDSADKFADKFGGIPNRHASYQQLLEDDQVDAIYIATPHPMHKEWAIKAANVGKHILCEKPIGLNEADAKEIVQSAEDNGVFLMEGYMYRCSAQTKKIIQIIESGAIGQVRSIEASFSFDIGDNLEGRHLNKSLAGGGILDVGGYPMTLAGLIAGIGSGSSFLEPLEIKAVGHIGQTGVDEYTSAVAKFDRGITARLSCGVALDEPINASITGTKGRLFIPQPWKPSPQGGTTELHYYPSGAGTPSNKLESGSLEVIKVTTEEYLYGAEADAVAVGIREKCAPYPAMSLEDTLALMRSLDTWRREIGLSYDGE